MSGVFLLDWAVLAVSLFNAILLLWLGLTVLLTAERSAWGIWLAVGGLLLGALFFLTHSALLGVGVDLFSPEVEALWRIGWVPVTLLPWAWYTVILWYTGFFDQRDTPLRRRHLRWFLVSGLLLLAVVLLLGFANPLPDLSMVIRLELAPTPSLAGIPWLVLLYPIYIVLCMGLALDALRRPGPSRRAMGALARERARPWFSATTVGLLLASLLVGWAMVWVVGRAQTSGYDAALGVAIARFDLAIESLIGVSVVLLGGAVVSYEVFTGKSLPRRGFARQWRRAVLLAAGYGVLVGWGLSFPLHPVFSMLLGAVLMTVFFALLGWRSYAERERAIRGLRPFVYGPQMHEQLLVGASPEPGGPDFDQAFRALCAQVLGAHRAYLVPVGPLGPLAGPPLVFPEGAGLQAPTVTELARKFDSPGALWEPLDPERFGGARWAVPLWSERGLIGLLLLGEKADGGLYTQEEIEVARASGERLIDVRATAELGVRLMRLQRRTFVQSQVLDQQTRRQLHDEILPALHRSLLELRSGGREDDGASRVAETLAGVHAQLSDLLRELPAATTPEVARYGLLGALRHMVEEELQSAFDEVEWDLAQDAESRVSEIPPLTAEVLFFAAREAIRNAARHGRGEVGSAPLALRIGMSWQGGLQLAVEDNGVGIDPAALGGNGNGQSGHGLALHSTMLAVVGGTLTIESLPGEFTRVVLSLPAG